MLRTLHCCCLLMLLLQLLVGQPWLHRLRVRLLRVLSCWLRHPRLPACMHACVNGRGNQQLRASFNGQQGHICSQCS